MWYVFNSNGEPVATCSIEPNHTDLTSRGEIAVKGDPTLPFPDVQLLNGMVIKKEPPTPTREELLARIKAERDRKLNDTAWVFMRQLTGTPEQKLPAEEYAKWEAYWAALRDFPDTCDPENPVWPVAPNEEVG